MRTILSSGQKTNAREAVKTRIKGEDSLDSMLLHNRQMQCIARGHLCVSHHNLFGANDSGPLDYKHLVGDAK